MASGGNNISAINTFPAQEAHVLYGAVVGGPDKYGHYFDLRDDWPETEVRSCNGNVVSDLEWLSRLRLITMRHY